MGIGQLILKNFKFLILFPLFIAGLVLAISAFQTPLYKSSVSLMVVQKQSEEVDARAAAQSAEQMADMLARIIHSEDFRNQVLATSSVKLQLSDKPWKVVRQWQEMVDPKNITDTGILIVDVYQPTSMQATKLASAVATVLKDKADDYLGVTTEYVFLRELNPPAPTSGRSASPNYILNGIVGWLFGMLAAFVLLLLFPNKAWNRYVTIPLPGFRSQRASQVGLGPVVSEVYAQESMEGSEASGLIYSDKLRESLQNLDKIEANAEMSLGARAEAALRKFQ